MSLEGIAFTAVVVVAAAVGLEVVGQSRLQYRDVLQDPGQRSRYFLK